jgi:type I restriction-modification system DNA methylase subunit
LKKLAPFFAMSLFQQSVLKKYLQEVDKTKLQEAWEIFRSYFHDSQRQENIRNLKEEEYQSGFLDALFVRVFGYTLNPEPDFNLVLEKKSVTDATKSDGAILGNGEVIAVIELKDTNTTDLEKVTTQAFGYKHKHKNCVYVITSNFEKLRFYINDSVEHLEFNLFQTTEDDFKVIWLCLAKRNLLSDLPLKVKQQSLVEEGVITKKLYSDYSQFKKELFNDISKRNSQYNRMDLFKKTQKLLDRFLFILFAEDRLLLPPNFIIKITEDWEKLQALRIEQSLYERFKLYFQDLNEGNNKEDIFAYNGGLFEPDEILDSITIDDTILEKGVLQLSSYDYNTDVDVNILGHIFEHSLSEIEEMQAELQGIVVDRNKTRRKKEGVFYTPRYITKYMVDSSLGALCEQKKMELKIVEDDYIAQKFKTSEAEGKRKKKLLKTLDVYSTWLLHLTICDPACGSGAFLNAALEFLITEHRYVDELTKKLLGYSLPLSWTPNDILEHNLFGVDINEEAVEIARLSLWLRTASKERKLSNLSENIKCGNSLIDDLFIDPNKAFNWEQEFPEVFATGRFDVVIGNPPYVDIKALPKDIVDYLFTLFESANNRINLFAVFIERALSILKKKGVFSFIIPSALLTQESYKDLRRILLANTQLKGIVRLPNESFGGGAGDVKVDTIILTFQFVKENDNEVEVLVYKGFDRINEISSLNTDQYLSVKQSDWASDEDHIFRINVNEGISDIISKIEPDTEKLIKCAAFCLGLTPYDKYKGHTPEQIANRVFHSTSKKDDTYKKLLAGNDVRRYFVEWGGEEWISYGDWLGAPREKRFFAEKRILVKQIIDWTDKRIWAALTDEELYNTQNAFNLIAKPGYEPEYLIAIINSRLMSFYLRKKFLEEYKDRFQKILIKDCKEFPIKRISSDAQKPFVNEVSLMISNTKELQELKQSLLNLLRTRYEVIKISNKLSDWPDLTFTEFLKELARQKIKLGLAGQTEWMHHFDTERQKAASFQKTIDDTDKRIDDMLYKLYGLTEEEIKIIETN